MGEVSAIQPLILELCTKYPNKRICITTSTITGLKQAKNIHPKVIACLSALDVPHLRNKQLNQINPGLICIVETEIWPNLLAWAGTNAVPVLFLNARMSVRSLPRYLWLKPLLRHLEAPVEAIYAQSEADAQRYKQVFSKPVFVGGNLKYVKKLTDYNAAELRANRGYTDQDFILCWGSSRPGEEALLVALWPKLKAEIPNLKLIIAIRHPQRTPEVVALLTDYPYCLYSGGEQAKDILVIDTLGVLDKAYAICDLAVVGGSFYDFGGHNPLEPAYYSKPIIMGEFYSSCKDSVAKLIKADAIEICDANTLSDKIIKLFLAEPLRKQMGEKAKKVLTENSHSLEIHLAAIEEVMKREI